MILQPEPLLSKVNEDDIIFYSWALFVQSELKVGNGQDDELMSRLVAVKKWGYSVMISAMKD